MKTCAGDSRHFDGLLDLEGDVSRDLGPILISLVRHNDGPLLDDTGTERQRAQGGIKGCRARDVDQGKNLSSAPDVISAVWLNDSSSRHEATTQTEARWTSIATYYDVVTSRPLRDAYALSSLASSSPSSGACSSGDQHQGVHCGL